jgi:hypothetical protein
MGENDTDHTVRTVPKYNSKIVETDAIKKNT